MRDLRMWFVVGLAGIVVLTAAVIMKSGSKLTIEISPADAKTLEDGKTSYTVSESWHADRARGTLVAYRAPQSPVIRVARVVALAGDRIEVDKRKVLVNGRAMASKRSLSTDVQRVVCPRGCAFVLADSSRGHDSIDAGPIPYDHILGSVE